MKRDPNAEQFIQHISGNAQVGMAGVNYGQVTIHQTTHQRTSTPEHQLQIKLSIGLFTYGNPPGRLDEVPTLVVQAINIGTLPSYVDRIQFEINIDGQLQVTGITDFGRGLTSLTSDKLGIALPPGKKHSYYYHLKDLRELGTLGQEVIPVSVHVYDEIGNMYQARISENMQDIIMNYFRS